MINMKKIAIILLLGFLALGIYSCDSFFDVNDNPNLPTNAPYYMIHPRAVMGTATATGGHYAILGCLWSEHFTHNNTTSQYLMWIRNSLSTADFETPFMYMYMNGIKNYELVKEKAQEAENWKYYLMSTVMEAYSFQVLTDLHDNIPFSEAALGLSGVLQPKYDTGQDVYDGIIERINDALEKDLTSSTNNAGEASTYDKIFEGDVDKWIQFANTLKLRIFLRQRYVRSDMALDSVKTLLSKNNFLSEDAKLGGFTDALGKANPLYGEEVANYGSTNGHGDVNLRACNTFLNFLRGNADSRVDFIYKYAQGTTDYKGINYGAQPTTLEVPLNSLSRGNFAATDPVVFISAAESQFLQAEAKEFAGESGKANYDAGVLASFAKFGLDGSSYIAAGGVYQYPETGTEEEKQEAIITQKWVDCAISNPIESFLEFNRTGYPDILIVSETSSYAGAFPKRLPYPAAEISRNPNCPQEQFNIEKKIWWDKKQ
jgi:hypothetical protein